MLARGRRFCRGLGYTTPPLTRPRSSRAPASVPLRLGCSAAALHACLLERRAHAACPLVRPPLLHMCLTHAHTHAHAHKPAHSYLYTRTRTHTHTHVRRKKGLKARTQAPQAPSEADLAPPISLKASFLAGPGTPAPQAAPVPAPSLKALFAGGQGAPTPPGGQPTDRPPASSMSDPVSTSKAAGQTAAGAGIWPCAGLCGCGQGWEGRVGLEGGPGG